MTNAFGTLELIRESLLAVVSEMRAKIIHSSYSSIIYEGHDFSCGLVLGDGRLIAQGQGDNPLHIFSVPYCAAEIVKRFADDINEGDIFLHNDPYTGGTHLNDILMLYPIFAAGTCVMFAAIRSHWGDVGGSTPGSLSGRATEIYQEGMRIVPTRFCERGRMNQAFLDLLFSNMRIAHERQGDFNSMLGASRKAAEHVGRLLKRFGVDQLMAAIEELIARAEATMRRRLAEIPDGIYHAEGYLDSDGHSTEPLIGRLKLTISGDNLVADFTGSSPQTMGPTNVGPALALTAVATVVKSYLDPHTSVNHGLFAPIRVINPPGSFLNARLPVPCGGMAECRMILAGLMMSALGQALPDKIVGDLKGGANHLYITGPRSGRDNLFLLYEYPAGGTGAGKGFDGNHGLRNYLEGDFNAVQSIETLEVQCPVRIERYEIRDGSCGDGEYRGGCGVVRDYRVLSDGASLSVLSDKNIIPPFGVSGGKGGAANRFVVIRGGTLIEPSAVPGKIGSFLLQRGDIVHAETAGGGGYGDPHKRLPESVQRDVYVGILSIEQARSRYGVVLDDNGAVNHAATQRQRDRLKSIGVNVTLRQVARDEFDGSKRIIRISPQIAEALEVSKGSLVELAIEKGAASLRGWVIFDGNDNEIALGPEGLAVLGARAGSIAEVRVVQTRLA